ncbi:serine/threonine-protein phosphatase 7 long form protein [Trifolium repens]|nr:serine/threonine-protein phosphatase 7 long form protein [Trifolium repens]
MNEPPLDTIMEVRDDFMLSPAGDSKPTLRTAHFLKPIANSIEESAFEFNPFSSSSSVFDPKEWPLTIHFNSWRRTHTKWVRWVDQLQLRYETIWKKVGIFEAIMSTKCRIKKYNDLLYGIVEKWCSETNTFVFSFVEATITLEDVMVLGGYPILGDPVFISLEDEEMREVEKKLILARKELITDKKQGGDTRTSLWMDIFIDKGSEIEHEAFLVTWLSIFVFPYRNDKVNSRLFPIAVHLAKGNPIALGPAVLASLYKDLSLFKKTIVDLSKYPVGADSLPLELTIQSPFYLVQIWVWERFKNLQPQPMLIDHGDPLLFRWRKVKDFKIDNVKLALDSAMDDFLWRPYVRYSDKHGMFYPNDEVWLPFEKDLDKEMLSFVICLRVSELVGFDSIEQYLPHRVALQFGIDQDVPGVVPRFNETKEIAWKNHCRSILDKYLYFPSRFFEADVTSRYSRWWKQSVLGCNDFVNKIVQKTRSESSRKHRCHVGKANIRGNDVGVPPGFPPHLVNTLSFGSFCDDVPAEISTNDCVKTDENIDASSILDEVPLLKEYICGGIINQSSSASLGYYKKILPQKRSILKDNIEHSIRGLEEDFENANGRKGARMSSERVCLSETQGQSKSCKSFSIREKVSSTNKVTVAQHDLQFHTATAAAQAETKETGEEKEREESDHEVVILSKKQYLKIQEELGRLARQQEEMFELLALRDKRDEELRQLLTSVLKNQQPPSSS